MPSKREYMSLNGWSFENERLYNEMPIAVKREMNRLMLLELNRCGPSRRSNFDALSRCAYAKVTGDYSYIEERQMRLLQRELLNMNKQ